MRWYYTIRHFVRRHFADLVVVGGFILLVLVIYLTNFRGDFWISGWDNLHPEFNFGANIKRAWFSAWQEYQGLGLPAGHGHATELIRELILLGISFVVNPQVIRKLYLVLMLFSGGLGTYFFLRHFLFASQEKGARALFSLSGAFFYLFNLATLQIFYTPYEAFITHYGFLPWLVYSLFYYFSNNSRKAYLLLVVVNLLGAAQFYQPTLFFVYLFLVLVVALDFKIRSSLAVTWGVIVKVLATIVVVNLYWLLPFVYSSTNNLSSQTEAQLNYLYSEDIYLKHAQFGSLADTALFKSFLFDTVDLQADGKYDYMVKTWIEHLQQKHIRLIGYAFFAFVLVGALSFTRQKKFFAFVFLFLLFFSLLAVNVFPLNIVEKFFRSFALVAQVFRNPFTKFANSLLFVEGVLFAFGIYTVSTKIVALFQNKRQKYVLGLIIVTIFLFQLGYIYPAFQGQFIYPKARVALPVEYFRLFAFFQNEGDGRIANLPQFTVSGWSYYRWGYGGSGFLWYGIRQPILDRAFDVWQKNNENYYWEIADALYSRNSEKFGNVLDKYQIQWLVVDENIVSPSTDKALYLSEMEEMIRSLSSKISLSADFDTIKVYRVNLEQDIKSYVFLVEDLPLVGPLTNWVEADQAYLDLGDYISAGQNTQGRELVYYPFRSLFTGRKQEDIEFKLKVEPAFFSFVSQLPPEVGGGTLFLPAYSDGFAAGWLRLFLGGELIVPVDNSAAVFLPSLDNKILEVRVAKEKIKLYDEKDSILDITGKKPLACDQFNQGVYQQDLAEREGEVYLRLTSVDASSCVSFNLPSLPQKDSYLMTIKSSFAEGKPLSFLLLNNYSSRPEIITSLPKKKQVSNSVFVMPAREPLDYGYTLHFDNQSIGQVTTVNYLGKIAVYKIPYRFLTEMKVILKTENQKLKTQIDNPKIEVEHPNPSLYRVSLKGESMKTLKQPGVEQTDYHTLVLSQAYDSGWKAYFIPNYQLPITKYAAKLLPFVFGEEVGQHVLVNNWANGWQIDSSRFEVQGSRENRRIIIVYLPQYLQYLGFLLLGLVPLVILRQHR